MSVRSENTPAILTLKLELRNPASMFREHRLASVNPFPLHECYGFVSGIEYLAGLYQVALHAGCNEVLWTTIKRISERVEMVEVGSSYQKFNTAVEASVVLSRKDCGLQSSVRFVMFALSFQQLGFIPIPLTCQ